MVQKNRPIVEFTAGRVRASVWRDEVVRGTDKPFGVFSVRVEKRYKDAQGKWQSTSSFNRHELADLELVVLTTRQYISMNERNPENQ